MAVFVRFEEIKAWQISRRLVVEIYKAVESSECRFDLELRRQLTSAAISTMSNIAEGFGRRNDGDFIRFLDISLGSASEVQSLLYVCTDIGYLPEQVAVSLREMTVECSAALAGLAAYLRKSRSESRKR
ncbi:MAG: four helix bundle protein [Bacteroidales bacterium]